MDSRTALRSANRGARTDNGAPTAPSVSYPAAQTFAMSGPSALPGSTLRQFDGIMSPRRNGEEFGGEEKYQEAVAADRASRGGGGGKGKGGGAASDQAAALTPREAAYEGGGFDRVKQEEGWYDKPEWERTQILSDLTETPRA